MGLQVLGKGAFGTVYLATDKADNKPYACKSINKAKLVTEVGVLSSFCVVAFLSRPHHVSPRAL